MFYPDIETLRIYASDYTRLPIYAQYAYDHKDIASIYQAFQGPYSFLVESKDSAYQGHYSIIALPCKRRLSANETTTFYYEKDTYIKRREDPMERLAQCMQENSPIYPNLPVFTGGAIGHFNYDVIRLYETLPDEKKASLALPLLQFGFVDDLLIIDHDRDLLFIVCNIASSDALEEAYADAKIKIQDMKERYDRIRPYTKTTNAKKVQVFSNYTKESFMNNVLKAKHYIHEGDIFQVVLSQRMEADYHDDPFQAYVNMTANNPSPYTYYLDFDDYVIAGASPELLLQARGNHIKTMPIAGTRKRGATEMEDMAFEAELQKDKKENAEHMMLVDLGRNDIGKVSEIGSVHVLHLKQIQRYSHVMHMTSEVHGQLRKDCTVLDALASLLPAGTLSGAPKIRAMEIIEELENTKREIYGGAIGFLGYNGQFDTCITIRTMIFHQQKVYLQAGAGIVKDSDPEKEYEETLHKAAVLLKAIHGRICV